MKTFAEFQESVGSLALKGGSKLGSNLIPAAAAIIGGVGTIMQSKKKDNDVNITPRGLKNLENAVFRGKTGRKLDAEILKRRKQKEKMKEVIKPKKDEVKKTKKLINKYKKEDEVAKQRELIRTTEKQITKPKKGEKKDASKTVKNFLKARKKEGETMYKLKQDDEIAKKGPGDLLPSAKKKYLDKLLKNLKRKKLNEGVGSLALKGGSKLGSNLIPAAAAIVGGVGTMMQIKNPERSVYTGTRKSRKKERIPTKADKKTVEVAKDLGLDLTDPRQRRKAQSRAIARGLKKQNKTNKKINPETDDVVKSRYTAKDKTIRFEPKKGEVKKSQEMIDKLNNPNYFDKIMRNIRKEEVMAAPTNNVGGGQIAGTVEAGDDPPVKKKKRYIYGGRGSRRMWMS